MLYFTVELFIDALILVLHYRTAEVQILINKIVEIYEQEKKESAYMENEFFELYLRLIQEVISLKVDPENVNDVEVFLLKFKSSPVILKDPELFTTLKRIFTDRTTLTKERYQYLTRKLANCILWYNNTKSVKKMFGKLSNTSVVAGPDKQEALFQEMSELCSEIIQINQDKSFFAAEDDNQARCVDFQNKETIAKAFRVFNKTSVTNVFRTGWQGLNRAFGPCGGWKLGESIVFNALSFNGKTMSLLKMARWQVTLNTVSPDFKNPTCIVYSLENETPQNTKMLFTELYINLKKELPPATMTDEQIIDFCYEHFSAHGWRLIVDRRLGAEFGFPELVANFEEYVRLGYTPLMCVIDYMNMLKKGASGREDGGGNHLLLRDVYTNTCNYLKSRNCTLVTAHQLNRKASEVVRQNPLGAVKKFDIGMLADGMDPQREVDVAIYQHKEFDSVGRAFMTFNMDKHRYDTETKDEDRYFAYQFEGPLGIMDDIDGPDRSTKNIHAVPFDNKGEGAAVSDGSLPLNLFG